MSEYDSEVREINIRLVQKLHLECTSAIRDEIQLKLWGIEKPTLVEHTLRQLLLYFSERSQSISLLTSFEKNWDAEILMRTFYECLAKIAFICFSSSSERQKLVEEFWGDLEHVHAHQQKHKASFNSEFFAKTGDADSKRIFDFLQDEQVFDFGLQNKSERKKLKQKWSFSEIIASLEEGHAGGVPTKGVKTLLHFYGMQSHLSHTDNKALDLVFDQATRPAEEQKIKKNAHLVRLMSDQVHLWYYALMAVCFHLGLDHKSDKVLSILNQFNELSTPFQEAFNRSQDEFYSKHYKD